MDKRKIELSQWLFLFGLVIASFHILPAFFQGFVYRSLTLGDVIDFATPWAVLPVAFFVYLSIGECDIPVFPNSPSWVGFRTIRRVRTEQRQENPRIFQQIPHAPVPPENEGVRSWVRRKSCPSQEIFHR